MICKSCRKEIPDGAAFCPWCGKPAQPPKRKPKNRGNGTGCVYQLPNKTYIAVRVLGYTVDRDGKRHRNTVSKSGFRTKKDAMEYLPKLTAESKAEKKRDITLKSLYDLWEPTHKKSKSTMDCYRAGFKWLSDLWYWQMSDITVDELQACMDDCTAGKRTKENMKALVGLLYKYAIPRNYATMNMGQYLVINAESGEGKVGIPLPDLEKIRSAVGSVPYADYVLAQCYLGFRPSELLALRVEDYNADARAFVGGAKTEAGRNRTVPASPKIQPIIDRLIAGKATGYVFCDADGSRMAIEDYRDNFYAVLKSCGIDNPVTEIDGIKYHKYTPHSCRHTFATMLKNISAPDKDKLKLIGHTSDEMLRHYQDVDLESLRKITDAL